MKTLSINAEMTEMSEKAFTEMLTKGEFEEVSLDELKTLQKAMEAGDNVLVPQDLEGIKVTRGNGEKSMKVVKRKKFGKSIKDVAMATGSDCYKGEDKFDLEKAKFNTKERKKLASEGEAMPDGSFPIRNGKDLSNAIADYGRAKDQAAAKKHIKKRAAALGMTGSLPENW